MVCLAGDEREGGRVHGTKNAYGPGRGCGFKNTERSVPETACGVDVAGAARDFPPRTAEVFDELQGAGQGAVLIGKVLRLGPTVGRECASHFRAGRNVRSEKIQAVSCTGRTRNRTVQNLKPGRRRVKLTDNHGRTRGAGAYLEINRIGVE